MDSNIIDDISEISKIYTSKGKPFIQYGTAGFRTKATNLDHVMFRMGLLAVLYSKYTKEVSGIMVTASHNPDCDNGIKLFGKLGEMLEASWEKLATDLANAKDEEVVDNIQKIIDINSIDFQRRSKVFLAHDTRKSCVELVKACLDGITAIKGEYTNYGLLTTPQIHYMVMCENTGHEYGYPSEEGYFQKLTRAFAGLVKIKSLEEEGLVEGSFKDDKFKKPIKVFVDAANGVGANKLKILYDHLPLGWVDIEVYNDGTGAECVTNGLIHSSTVSSALGLNENCGADYVKVNQKPPEGLEKSFGDYEPYQQYASLDGDGDRIVFFYLDSKRNFHLMDGDKIATLIAKYLKETLRAANLDSQTKLGIVQTAYANGSSTDYLAKTLGVGVHCTPTGVKYLHKKAQELDVGIYFEANGHGTVLYSPKFLHKLKDVIQDPEQGKDVIQAAYKLQHFSELTNQSVGDALSDLLLVEIILLHYEWGVLQWDAMYQDLPNRQTKLKVKDRNVVRTTVDEKRCTAPAGLQDQIDQLVDKVPRGRAFVRPSGTEDIVRIYAEGESQDMADKLAHDVSLVTYQLAGGQGEQPSLPPAP